MRGLLRAISTMFTKNEKPVAAGIESVTPPALGDRAALDELAQLSAQLAVASQLLIAPTPGSVCQVEIVLEEVRGRIARLNRDMRHDPDQIRILQGQLARVRSLAEGALRVQWTKMRAVMALTQSYSVGGNVSHWQPPMPKVDLKI
jgi:hypothetical protein